MLSFRNTGTPPHLRPFAFSVPHKSWSLLLIVALATAAAYGQASPDEPKSTVRGVVINELTQTPVPRALVHSLDNRYATLTDGEGRFEFTLQKADTNTRGGSFGTMSVGMGSVISYGPMGPSSNNMILLTARKPGYIDDPSARRDVVAVAGSDVAIALMPEALIKGRVTLSTGEPATGVSVTLFFRRVVNGLPRWMQTGSSRVNSEGEFRFADLQPGSYRLSTQEFMDNDPLVNLPGGQRYGCPPVYFPGASDFNSAGTVEISEGGTVQADLTLTQQPYYDVKIPVVSNPEISGGVSVSVKGQRGPGYSLGYNSGSHKIEGLLPSGNYDVEASTSAESSLTGSVNLRVTRGPANGPTMTMVGTSSVSLNVKEEFAETSSPLNASWSDGTHTYSIHGARLYLQAQAENAEDLEEMRGGGSLRQPTGPNDDSMVIANLQPGRYWLRLSSTRGYVASATFGGVDVLHEPITVAPASTLSVDVTMRDDGGKIEGTLPAIAQSSTVDPVATPHSPPAWVYCIPRPNSVGQFETLVVSRDGKFHSRVMAPGDYLVLAFAERQPSLPYRDAEAMKAYESKGQIVHVSAGQDAVLQLDLIPGRQ